MLSKKLVATVLALTGTVIADLAHYHDNTGKPKRQELAGPNDSLEWISTNTSLPKVVVYDAGGTILSTSNYSRLDNVNYGSGYKPTVENLIGNVSEVLNVAQLAVVQFAVSGGSSGINSSLYLNISQYANRQLCSKDSDIAGAVMLHGTNTLEETASSLAFGVDLTFNCSKPFIATGAMRPDSYISPDGRSNFYQAVAAAVSPSSRNRGGFIVFNDRITSIFYSTKIDANTPDTFKAIEQGNLGVFLAGQPFYYFGASYPTGRPYFDVTNTTELPPVVILYGHQGFDASLMYAAVANGAKGLVVMGPGAAQLSPSAQDAAADLYSRGVPTVAVPRTVTGTGVPGPVAEPIIYSSYQIATLSRIMLQLSINAGYGLDEIRALFEDPVRQAVYGPWVNQQAYGLAM
ncbi:Asparaginase/glutaminase [Xylaria castorea]|nr:Asparaginase/glutaminase [Xylaria castorea]